MLCRPLFELAPVSAHPHLVEASAWWLCPSVARRVIGVANDILAQLIKAMECMACSDPVWHACFCVVDIPEQRSLYSDLVTRLGEKGCKMHRRSHTKQ